MQHGKSIYLAFQLIGRGYAKDGIMKTTEEAFDKIAQAVE
jgi:hypothetical protein